MKYISGVKSKETVSSVLNKAEVEILQKNNERKNKSEE
jgi:hypothetical protein